MALVELILMDKKKTVTLGGVDVRELDEKVLLSSMEKMNEENKKEILEYLESGVDKIKEERTEIIKYLISEVDIRIKAKEDYWRYGIKVEISEIRKAWGTGHVQDESFLIQFRKYLRDVNNKYEAGFSSVSGDRKFYLRKKEKHIFLDGDEK